MILKRSVLTLAIAAACAMVAPVAASASARPSAGLLPMASSWQSPSSGIVLAYPSRTTGARPYLLVTGDAGRTWRTLPAPPVRYPADNDQPDAVWADGAIVVTDGTHIEVTRDDGDRWTAERLPGGVYVDQLVIGHGRLFALLTSDTRAAVYSAPLGAPALRAIPGLSIDGGIAYGDITGVGGALQVDLGANFTTQRYWYSRAGTSFRPAPLPCPATEVAMLGGVRDGRVVALCDAGPSAIGPGETQNQVRIASRLGGTFHGSGPLSDSPNDLGFAAASASDLTVATVFDLSVTRDAGRTWTAQIPQNNGATWSDLSFTTATTGTVVCSTANDKGDLVFTVYRTTNGGRGWQALRL